MSVPNIDQLLGELRTASALAAGKTASPAPDASQVDFSAVLKSTLEQVNSAQQTSQEMQKQFELGDEGVNLQDVMVSLQKASLSFQTMVQARNKLVTAYQEIMNTQV
ncbi:MULTISPECIES: flagellar hook-basal body complex protein FliE [Chromobacterium]|uniref:Flagellar hook-basal body complex protein FliE n=1 Tax=Chromobacterium aquaticum TaxID=467180 RepID=A0ABV8ZWG5_9NEIS|nr:MULTISPECIES: flagellar hook-basal body complex protein FliE [Chromobacterium]KMN34882.1 flagellar hook-basal body protein FliE [Chromobacterium sp. LK1]MCD5362046.1 flagellar hook-basal body complex protein FliE [Chromobacterium aquaticum]